MLLKSLKKMALLKEKVIRRIRKLNDFMLLKREKRSILLLFVKNQFSNREALKGFSEKEAQQVRDYLVRIRKNIDGDWDTVKHGGTRQY